MRAFLIAGEASGDKLGAALIEGLAKLAPECRIAGVGGDQMRARGLASLFDMNELSVMGLAEVLPKYRHLKRRIRQCAQAVLDSRPDVLITIDSPDFCLRVARMVREADPDRSIRTVHYVAPSVWAWRPGRAAKMARWIDQVLALLPFEPPYMQAAGMRCDFVGHPVVAEPPVAPAEAAAFRESHGLGRREVILALPGSRRSEVKRLAPVFGEALRRVLQERPEARVLVPAAAHVAPMVRGLSESWPGRPMVLDPTGLPPEAAEKRKRQALAAADLALAASGTVSLELCAADTPMVVAYDLHPISWQIMSRMARIDTVTLANLVTGERVIPEFLGPDCRPAPIAAAMLKLARDADARREQARVAQETLRLLGADGDAPGLRAARAVLDGLADAKR